jgi:DNA-binding NarL/FixJ family response regulator
MFRVLMVDDYPLLREGARSALDEMPDIHFIGFADHAGDVLRLIEQLQPDLLLYSSRPVESLALDVLAEITQRYPATKLVVMTTQEQGTGALAAVRQGARGALLKDDPLPLFQQAIRVACQGGVWISPSLSLVRKPVNPSLPTMNERERALLELLARGWDNPTIAAQLSLAEQTVRNYTSALYRKLGAASRAEAIVWALQNGYGKHAS